MDAERPAPLGDVDDPGDELGHLLLEEGELVDDDDQARRCHVGPPLLELRQVLAAVLAQDLLATAELGVERDERPPGQVGVEVGEEADRVRQLDAVLERRAALVVDQHERQGRGRVGGGERSDVALQELALAGPRGAGGQAVRAVAPAGRRRPGRRRPRRSVRRGPRSRRARPTGGGCLRHPARAGRGGPAGAPAAAPLRMPTPHSRRAAGRAGEPAPWRAPWTGRR